MNKCTCGNDAVHTLPLAMDKTWFAVHCECGAMGISARYRDEARGLWNQYGPLTPEVEEKLLAEIKAQGALVVEKTDPRTCKLCGNEGELRPYGPGGANVCFPCGMKDPKATMARFDDLLGHKPAGEGQ